MEESYQLSVIGYQWKRKSCLLSVVRGRSRTEIRSQESGVRSQESGVRGQGSGEEEELSIDDFGLMILDWKRKAEDLEANGLLHTSPGQGPGSEGGESIAG